MINLPQPWISAYLFSRNAVYCVMVNLDDTNLMTGKTGKDLEKIREAIIWGGSREKANSYSPPWGDELTWTEIESVTMFVQKLRADTEAAQSLLKQQSEKNPDMPNTELGRVVYENRCIICHGESGKGEVVSEAT